MDKRSHIKYKKVEFDKIIDINLDSGIFIENKDDNHYNNLDYIENEFQNGPKKCFPKKKEISTFIRELLKINPKII